MVDLSKLTPAEMARHLGKPDGEVGVAVSLQINKTNGNIISETYRRLNLVAGLHVLEIGPANGHLLPELLGHADGLHYVGIDISKTMVDEACRFNAATVAAGQAAFHVAGAEHIPAADVSFDRVFAVNVIYFWPDAVVPLREIRRVLRPSGYSLIAAATPESLAARSSTLFSRENGFNGRDVAALIAVHKEAGFSEITVELVSEMVPLNDGTEWKRDFNFVIARP